MTNNQKIRVIVSCPSGLHSLPSNKFRKLLALRTFIEEIMEIEVELVGGSL